MRSLHLSIFILAAILWSSCSTPPEADRTAAKLPVPEAEQESDAGIGLELAALKLFVFDCGRLSYDSLEMLGIGDDETEDRDLIVPCFVIEHEQGRLLWEGGLPSSYAEQEGWKEMPGGWRLRLDRTFEQSLAEIGWTLDEFDFMAFSHFHFDHVGVIGEVPKARLLIPKDEYETAFTDSPPPGYPLDLYGSLAGPRSLVFEGEHDVFGDGRVRLIPAPGHTPGHQVLFVDLAKTGPVVLAGDLYVFSIGREKKRVLAIDAEPERSRESMDWLEAFLQESGASLWIGHDLDRFEKAPKPPGFLD